MNIQRNLLISVICVFFVFVIGISGYCLIEGWDFLDALFMTVITLATVGYGETHPLSPAGRIFTIFLILIGMGILLYTVTTGITFLLEGHLGGVLKRRKMEKKIADLNGHYIICASGEMGMYVIEEFHKKKTQFVVISPDCEVVLPWVRNREEILHIGQKPESDEVLFAAGIEKAKGLIAVMGEDRENLFVALSARQLNPKLRIVAQAVERPSIPKLRRAGADDIVSSMEIGAMRIASTMLRPVVVNFLDKMLYEDRVLRFEEQVVPEKSRLSGRKLSECRIPEQTGLMVAAIKDAGSEKYLYNPSGNTIVKSGDVLIVLGDVSQLESLAKLIS